MSNRSFTVLCLLLGAFAAPFTASTQVLYGSLTGNVTDVSGSAVPNAKVDAVNISNGIGKQATTDGRGVFLMQDLQAGVYKVTISAPSFSILVESGVQIAENLHPVTNPALDAQGYDGEEMVQTIAEACRLDGGDVIRVHQRIG